MSHSDPAPHAPLILSVGDLIDEVAVRLDAPWRRGSDAAARITRRRGGSAANVAVAAAAAGGRSRFLGAVGADATGDALEAALLAAGVEPSLQRRGRSPSIVVIVEPDGERTMLPDRGVATSLEHPGRQALDDVSWLHVPAYSLFGEPLATTARRLIADAAAAGLQTSVDASSIGALEAWGGARSREELAALGAGHLFANEEEADYLGLLTHPLPRLTCIIKRGAGAAEVRDPGGALLASAMPPQLPDGIDTTGAGDAFAGGFVVARAAGAPWEDALHQGHGAAARHLIAQQGATAAQGEER